MTDAINMTLVSIKPSLFEGDPSLAFYNAAADISVFICTTAAVQEESKYYYKLTVVGKLQGLPIESIGDYARAAWLELMPVGDTVIEVTTVQEKLTNDMFGRLCIVSVIPDSKSRQVH